MKIIRCTDGPFADHIAFVREGFTRVELYDVHFRSSPEPYRLEFTADGEAMLRWARGSGFAAAPERQVDRHPARA